MVAGAFVALVGVLMPQPKNPLKVSLNAILLEQSGLAVLAAGNLFFVVAIWLESGPSRVQSAATVAAYGLAAAWQWMRIQRVAQPDGRVSHIARRVEHRADCAGARLRARLLRRP